MQTSFRKLNSSYRRTSSSIYRSFKPIKSVSLKAIATPTLSPSATQENLEHASASIYSRLVASKQAEVASASSEDIEILTSLTSKTAASDSVILTFPTLNHDTNELSLSILLSDTLSLGSRHAFPSLTLPFIKFSARTRATSAFLRLQELLLSSEYEECFVDLSAGSEVMLEAIRTIALARELLQRDGLDCFFSIDNAVSTTRLRVYRTELAVPVIDVADFSSLESKLSVTLSSVITDTLQRRPEADLTIKNPSEMALAIKALSTVTTKSFPKTKGRSITGGCCSFIRPLSTSSFWPLVLSVGRLPSIASTLGRSSVMGASRGKCMPDTSTESLRKAMSAELANHGYWSLTLHSPKLVQVAIEAASSLERSLAQRNCRIAIVPEFVPTSSQKGVPSSSPKPSSQLVLHFIECDEDMKVVEMLASFLRSKSAQIKAGKDKTLTWETAVYGPEQLLSIHKAAALYNNLMSHRRAGSQGAGGIEPTEGAEGDESEMMTLRPFIGPDRILSLMIECKQVKLPPSPSSSVPPAVPADQVEAVKDQTAEGSVSEPVKRLEREHMVSKASDPKMLARALSWEAMSRRSKGSRQAKANTLSKEAQGVDAAPGPPSPPSLALANLKMAFGRGESLLIGCTALAMAQDRISSEIATSEKGEGEKKKTEGGDRSQAPQCLLFLPQGRSRRKEGRSQSPSGL